MASVAGALRAESQAELSALSAAERIELALSLGRRDLLVFASAQGLPQDRALQILRQRRQLGRQPSRCMDALAAETP